MPILAIMAYVLPSGEGPRYDEEQQQKHAVDACDPGEGLVHGSPWEGNETW
jgi:hypothetical protein